jgi:hypothetical protein
MKKEHVFGVFAILGLILLIVGTVLCINTFDYSNKAEATATITQIDVSKKSRPNGEVRKYHDTHLKYEVDGKSYTCIIGDYLSSWDVGDKIEIYYDIDDPYSVGVKDTDIGMITIPCIGAVFFTLGGVGLLVSIKKKKSSAEKEQ